MTSIDLAVNTSLHQAPNNLETRASLAVRVFGGFSYGFLSFVGIALNVMLVMILRKDKSFVTKSAFYVIVWQSLICDLLTHVMQIIIAVPITLAGRPVG